MFGIDGFVTLNELEPSVPGVIPAAKRVLIVLSTRARTSTIGQAGSSVVIVYLYSIVPPTAGSIAIAVIELDASP